MDEKEKKEPVEVEAVKVKKKSALGSFVEDAVEDAGRGLISYLVNEQLIPLAEKALRGVADWLLGKMGGHSDPRDPDQNGPYRRYSRSSSSYERRKSKSRDAFGIDRIIFRTKSEAERVLRGLEDQISQYRVASVADLYELLGEDCPWTATDYGWTSLATARIDFVSEGYHLKLPPVMMIVD